MSAPPSPPPGLPPLPGPDPGAPELSAEALQHLVDQAASLNLFSQPAPTSSSTAIRDEAGVIGFRIDEHLHRFEVITEAPQSGQPPRSHSRVGEIVGRFSHRWHLAPDDFVAGPGQAPPPTALDPSRSQRFVMLDGTCTFGNGQDGFRGFGAGHTVPAATGGQPELRACAVGTVLEGFGRFAGYHGTYLYCGVLSPERGFVGSLMARVMDPEERLRTSRSLPGLQPRQGPEVGVTYAVLRGEAVPSDPVLPNLGPDGRPIGLVVKQGLRLMHMDCADRNGIHTRDRLGQRVGEITAHVVFNPAAASGSDLDPIPFTTYDELVISGPDGAPCGTILADSSEGRVFNVKLAGHPAIRFGGAGRLRGGTGLFAGISGLMTDNSVVVFSPHVSASVYVLRIDDPDGRFALGAGG